jgi:hypothetical protein
MGRLIKLCGFWMSQKRGKGDALRKEQALCILLLTDKSMAFGGPRPAGFDLSLKTSFSPDENKGR